MIPVNYRTFRCRRGAFLLVLVACLVFLCAGCDETSSESAKLEDARIAIDDGQYAKALTILEDMTGKEVLELRASAHAGQAGIDTFELMAEMGDNGEIKGIDLVGKMLGVGEDKSLTKAVIGEKSQSMDLAISNLLDSVAGDKSKLDDDGKTKLAIYGLTDTALILGDLICTGYGETSVTLTESWLKNTFAGGGDRYAKINPTQAQLDDLSRNISYVSLAISVLGNDNDLEEEFASFRQEIGGDDNVITTAELKHYLNSL